MNDSRWNSGCRSVHWCAQEVRRCPDVQTNVCQHPIPPPLLGVPEYSRVVNFY